MEPNTPEQTDLFFSCIITWLCSLYRFIQSSSQMGLFYLRQDWRCHNFQAISTIYLFDHQAASVDSPLLILMFSKCDFPFRLREKKSLTQSSIVILLNNGGFRGLKVLVTGPISASNLGLKNIASEILSLSEFTVTLCSMLVKAPLLRICKMM